MKNLTGFQIDSGPGAKHSKVFQKGYKCYRHTVGYAEYHHDLQANIAVVG